MSKTAPKDSARTATRNASSRVRFTALCGLTGMSFMNSLAPDDPESAEQQQHGERRQYDNQNLEYGLGYPTHHPEAHEPTTDDDGSEQRIEDKRLNTEQVVPDIEGYLREI